MDQHRKEEQADSAAQCPRQGWARAMPEGRPRAQQVGAERTPVLAQACAEALLGSGEEVRVSVRFIDVRIRCTAGPFAFSSFHAAWGYAAGLTAGW